MRKIGILTFHNAENYGAVLQAFALQKYLQKEFSKDEIKIFDFTTKKHIQDYRIFKKRSSSLLKNLALQFFVIFRYRSLKLRKLKFKNFIRDEISLTQTYENEPEFLTNIAPMDIYITGSDQVFNPHNKYFKAYYMAFEKNEALKIAYAPSFGISNFTPEISEKVETYLKDFDALSCREAVGADFISSLIGKPVPIVCDPVFLLNKEDWLKVSNTPIIECKYIFVYDLNGGKNLIEIANKIKAKTGYKIICQTQTVKSIYKVDSQRYSTGPREFIGLIANAEYVITDSFHGTAFSIIMRKKFYSYIAFPLASSRILNILNILDLQDNIISSGEESKFFFISKDLINYEVKLNDFIFFSQDFLKMQLG